MIKRLLLNVCTDSNIIEKVKNKYNLKSHFIIIDNVTGEIHEHVNVIALEKHFTQKIEDYQKIISKTITIQKYADLQLKNVIYKIEILKLR